MSRWLFVAGSVVAVAGCAAFKSVTNAANAAARGDFAGASQEAAAASQEMERIRKESERCAELETKVVSYQEETQIGGAVALALASKANGVFIEPSPALPPGPVRPSKDKPRPGAGQKTDLNRYLNELGKGLAAASGRPNIDWTFMVLDSKTANAFSAPGGYVFVTTGLLEKLENEAQLAAVLAHEIGHVTGRHSLGAYKASKAKACKMAFLLKLGAQAVGPAVDRLIGEWSGVLGKSSFDVDKASAELIVSLTDAFAEQLTTIGMGHELEYAADRTAVELMTFSGYDPGELEKLTLRLPDGGALTPHPKNADRVAEVRKYRATELGAFGADDLKAPPLSDRVKVVAK